MGMPLEFINGMKDLHFSMKLCRIMKRLFDECYSVQIERHEASALAIIDPLRNSDFLIVRIEKEGMEPVNERFRCAVVNYGIDPLLAKENYDNLADTIYNKIFAKADESKPRIFTVSKEEALFIKNLKEELASRGDFTVDIPKFVDVLFKLGVMIPKEDIEKISKPEPDEEDDVKEIPW